MAEYVVVDKEQLESDLTAIADSIRGKADTTESLNFPEGFTSAVDSIKNVGIIFSYENDDCYPVVADMRSLPKPTAASSNDISFFCYLFQNYGVIVGHFCKLKEVYVPDWIKGISFGMFRYCTKLTTIHGELSNVTIILAQGFAECYSLTELPSMPNLTEIQNQGFVGCTGLTKIVLPPKLAKLDQNVFWKCTGLTEVTFQCIPTTLADSAFNSCTNITTVNLVEGWNISINLSWSPLLSAECIADMINKLASVETAQTITLNSEITLTDEQKATINTKGWTLVQ